MRIKSALCISLQVCSMVCQCTRIDVDEESRIEANFIQLLFKIELLKFPHLSLCVCVYLEEGSEWVNACNLPPSTSCFLFFLLLLHLVSLFLSVLCSCGSQSPSPLCFSQVRKFVSKDSAGLRVRSHPSLQSEQIGIVHVNGTITFIDEVIDLSPGRI